MSCRPGSQIRKGLKSGVDCVQAFSAWGIMQCRVTRRQEEEEIKEGKGIRTEGAKVGFGERR